MKTTLRAVALCLLMSQTRGFANTDYSKLACEMLTAAAKLYVGTLVLVRGLEAAQVLNDKVSDAVPTLGTVLDYSIEPVLKFVDIRKPLGAAFGCTQSK